MGTTSGMHSLGYMAPEYMNHLSIGQCIHASSAGFYIVQHLYNLAGDWGILASW